MNWFTVLVCVLSVVAVDARAQVVQLPTIQNFGMSTTISVPDRGRTYVGGVNRSYRSSSRRGSPLLPNTSRSYSGGASSSGVSASAYIHDLDAMDRMVLQQAGRDPDTIGRTAWRNGGRNVGSARNNVTRRHASAVSHSLPRVSDVRRQVVAARAEKLDRAKSEIRTALKREKAGDLVGAQAAFRRAMRYASPEYQKKISARLDALAIRMASRP